MGEQPVHSKKRYSFFQNCDCEYFPCHKTENPENFNCIFCYCPLYALGETCGGNFVYLASGIKDCSHCILPHLCENYDLILKKFPQIAVLAAKKKD